jgi:DNA-binding SARP family transcriptional activator
MPDDGQPGPWASEQARSVVSPNMSPVRPENSSTHEDPSSPLLIVHCLGPFQVFSNNKLIERWPSSKGKSIFKYLVTNRGRPIAKEVLMDLFWPEADPDAARNNLNVAIYGLRQAFREDDTDFSHVLYQNEHYLLNSELQVWLDVEEFMAHFQSGHRLQREGLVTEAVREYHAAEALYQGEFLEEDRYEEWLMPLRRQITSNYLELLERLSQYYFNKEEYASCISICRSMLSNDPCLEDAHCRLICCHYRQGQQHLALRQYHQCVKALKEELEVAPGPKTEELYEKIRHHEAI